MATTFKAGDRVLYQPQRIDGVATVKQTDSLGNCLISYSNNREFWTTPGRLAHAPPEPEPDKNPAPVFKPGDVVRLKSGGPVMTAYMRGIIKTNDGHSFDGVGLVWWDGDTYQHSHFPHDALILAEPTEK